MASSGDGGRWYPEGFAFTHRGAVSWAALVVGALAVVLPVIGERNPWNLVIVDRAFSHPIVGGFVVAAAVCALTYLWVDRAWLRVLAIYAATGASLLWALGWAALASLEPRSPVGDRVSPFNRVEARLLGDPSSSAVSVWLVADRGLLSRENHVGLVGTSASGPPSVDGRFTAPDEFVVSSGGEIVLRVRFRPGDLTVVHTECRTVQSEWGSVTAGSCGA